MNPEIANSLYLLLAYLMEFSITPLLLGSERTQGNHRSHEHGGCLREGGAARCVGAHSGHWDPELLPQWGGRLLRGRRQIPSVGGVFVFVPEESGYGLSQY